MERRAICANKKLRGWDIYNMAAVIKAEAVRQACYIALALASRPNGSPGTGRCMGKATNQITKRLISGPLVQQSGRTTASTTKR